MSIQYRVFNSVIRGSTKLLILLSGRFGIKFLAALSESIPPQFFIETSRGKLCFVAQGRSAEWRGRTLLTKEPETIDWINSFASHSVFLDVGANIGIYSLYAALDKTVTVYGVEPSYGTIAIFFSNICANKMDDRVRPIAAGLGVKREILSLNMNQINGGEAGHALDSEIVFKGKTRVTNYKQATIGISIDKLLSDFNIPTPNYIKIDVDGTEDKILEGAKNTLLNKNLKSVLIEFDDADISGRLTKFLLDYGFKIRQRDINPNSGNVIFDRF